MQDVVVGLLAIAVGALFAFRGYFAMRVIIPIWGAFAGFMLGAGLVSSASNDGFLRSVLGWVIGIVLAALFALAAYLYYEISVTIAMAAIGFALGTSLMAALGVTWSWLVILVGVAAGILLAAIAILGDLPTVILVVLTAMAGASTIVAGLMLLVGAVDTGDFENVSATQDARRRLVVVRDLRRPGDRRGRHPDPAHRPAPGIPARAVGGLRWARAAGELTVAEFHPHQVWSAGSSSPTITGCVSLPPDRPVPPSVSSA